MGNLIVEGIAGSGKTSVALHRIDNLRSDNILIFSPNKVFSEYISNVLPELGEKNTMQTTINDFLSTEIKEFYDVETFTSFIERSYSGKCDFNFIKYKQSDRIYDDIDKYIEDLCNKIRFNDDLFTREYSYTKSELDYMLNIRYSKLPLGSRIQTIAEKISENNFNGRTSKSKKISKELHNNYSNVFDYSGDEYNCIRLVGKFNKNNKKIDEYNFKSNHKVCQNCTFKNLCTMCVADKLLGNEKFPFDDEKCNIKIVYDYALQKVIEIFDDSEEKMAVFLNNYYNNYLK